MVGSGHRVRSRAVTRASSSSRALTIWSDRCTKRELAVDARQPDFEGATEFGELQGDRSVGHGGGSLLQLMVVEAGSLLAGSHDAVPAWPGPR